MAEAVSAQMEVARRMIEVEREPLKTETSTETAHKGNGKEAQAENQVTMFDLFQRHGRQPKRSRRSNQPQSSKQLSLFGSA